MNQVVRGARVVGLSSEERTEDGDRPSKVREVVDVLARQCDERQTVERRHFTIIRELLVKHRQAARYTRMRAAGVAVDGALKKAAAAAM